MEYHRLQAADRALMLRLAREPLEYNTASDSDEAESEPEGDPPSEEEAEGKENTAPTPAWSTDMHDIRYTSCTARATVVLPRNRDRSELGYVRCFLTNTLINIMVSSTNAYALSHRASPAFTTDAAEMWRYIAARIRMGIARLPEIPMYWKAGYRDDYIMQLFPYKRFKLLQRYWRIPAPTPAGEPHNAVQKISSLYHDCQRLFQAYYTPGEAFAIDESMVRCKGRTNWKTTIKTKPTPTGYKMYTVGSDGYLLGFTIYRGKGGYSTPHAAIHHTVTNMVRP